MDARTSGLVASIGALSVACASPSLRAPTAPPLGDSTTCYSLRFSPWVSSSGRPFATASVGMQAPMPDTIALTHRIARTAYGSPLYSVLMPASDSGHAGATWTHAAQDSVIVSFPPAYGWQLQLRLGPSANGVRGNGWVYPENPSDFLAPMPMSGVIGARIPCPRSLGSSSPGA